jgi:hypothetical protein
MTLPLCRLCLLAREWLESAVPTASGLGVAWYTVPAANGTTVPWTRCSCATPEQRMPPRWW